MDGMNTGLEGARRLYDTAKFSKHTLPNGVTIWLQNSPIHVDNSVEIVGFLPNVGAQLDPNDMPGTAHFFEHAPFRGTQNKPSTEAILEPIREKGGDIDAATGPTHTWFAVKNLPKQDLELGIETLAEMMLRPLLREEDIEIERRIIAEKEYQDYATDPQKVLQSLMLKRAFQAHPRGHEVLGEPEVIKTMTAGQLRKFHAQYYHAANLQFVCGGNLPAEDEILEITNKYFGALPSSKPTPNPQGPLHFGKPGTIEFLEPLCGQDTLVLMYLMETTWDHELLSFFADTLSGGMTSPLVLELRNKRGMAYRHEQCWTWIYPDLHCFHVTFFTPASTFREVEGIYRDTLLNLSPDFVVKRQRERQYARQSNFQHPVNACHNVPDEVVNFGRPTSHWEDEEHEDQLTLDKVFQLRNYLLNTEPLRLEIRSE